MDDGIIYNRMIHDPCIYPSYNPLTMDDGTRLVLDDKVRMRPSSSAALHSMQHTLKMGPAVKGSGIGSGKSGEWSWQSRAAG